MARKSTSTATKTKTSKKKTAKPATASAESAAPRYFEFEDGKSHKFWKIQLDGSAHTVNFGKVGAAGQTQTKEFDSPAAAQKSYEKLIEEKVKKGYVEESGNANATTPMKAAPAKAATKKKTSKKSDGKPDESSTDIAAETIPATETSAADEVDLRVTHEVDLEPGDYLYANLNPLDLPERDKPEPFDLDACMARLGKLKVSRRNEQPNWSLLKLPESLSPEEAQFWLLAILLFKPKEETTGPVQKRLAKRTIDGKIGAQEVIELITKGGVVRAETALTMANVLSPEDYVEVLLSEFHPKLQPWIDAGYRQTLFDGFQRYVRPYLTKKQTEEIRRRLQQNWDPTSYLTSRFRYWTFPTEYYVAAAVGMSKEIQQLVATLPDDMFSDWWVMQQMQPLLVLVGLGSPAEMETHWRRLSLVPISPVEVGALLAVWGPDCAASLAKEIIERSPASEVPGLVSKLGQIRAPEVAVPMLQFRTLPKPPAAAKEWLNRQVGNAVAGLLETAAEKGKLADAALEYLRDVKRRGYESVIAECVQQCQQPEVAERITKGVLEVEEKTYAPLDDKTTPNWLQQGLKTSAVTKPKKLPDWLHLSLLPPLVVGDHCLNEEQVSQVLQFLLATPISEKHPVLDTLREQAEKQSRDDFAWKMFTLWQESGSVSKEKWAMGTIGHLGDDGCVMKLTPLVRAWPGESQHQRAVFGLDCLRAIGSNTALMQLSGIAQKLKFQGLRNKAKQYVDEIAKERGMTRDELEDRVIPDCGLDEQGRREFSFGPRCFSFVLGGDLKPMVKDADGKIRPNMPKPGVKDDAAVANASLAEWKLIKKQIKEVATVQAARLEQAMVTGRRWSAEEFETLLVRHPLMTHLIQKLICAAFDKQGKRVSTFRVTEERDYADAEDNAISIANADSVGVVHPLEMSEAERAKWGEVLSDYEIVSPFQQLGRPVYQLEKGEEKEQFVKQFQGLKLVAPTLVFTLEKLGWLRGVAMDAGCFTEHSKQFPAGKVTAVVEYEGVVGMGYIDPNELLTITSVYFCPGMRMPSGYGWDSKKKLRLGEVPEIVMSEVLANLHLLAGKAK